MYSKRCFIYLLLLVYILGQQTSVICFVGRHGSRECNSAYTPPESHTEPNEYQDVLQHTYAIQDEIFSLDWEIRCKLQPSSWKCSNKTLEYRFYYDIAMQACKTFEYRGCSLLVNSFATLDECASTCFYHRTVSDDELLALSKDVSCRLQHDFGRCFEYHPMFYYDISDGKCKSFSFSGCGGNKNRFPTHAACVKACSTTTNGKPDV